MKKISLIVIAMMVSLATTSYAQEPIELICGDTLSSQFSSNQSSQSYTVEIDSGTRLIVHADPLPLGNYARLSVEIQNPNGALIGMNRFAPEDRRSTIETAPILSSGDYTIEVNGRASSAYQLFVSCITEEGDVLSENNLVQSLSCGEQIDNTMVREDELHRYYLMLEDEMIVDIFLESLYGRFGEMTFEMGLYSPTNQELNRMTERFKDVDSQIAAQNITTSGLHRLYVKGFDSVDEDYRLSVDCSLPDGGLALSSGDNRRVLAPTILEIDEIVEAVADIAEAQAEEIAETAVETTEDLSAVQSDEESSADSAALPPPSADGTSDLVALEYELIEGLPNTGQLTDTTPIVVYSFDGEADGSVTLSYNRVRGNSPVEMWVRAPEGNIIFNTTLDTTYALAADTTLPTDGTYRIFLALGGEMDVVFTVEVVRP